MANDARAELRHPHAPERCPVCEWTNINLMNYGDADRSAWMCHGCAARTIAEVRHWRGLLSKERVEALRDVRCFMLIACGQATKAGSLKGVESSARIMETIDALLAAAPPKETCP